MSISDANNDQNLPKFATETLKTIAIKEKFTNYNIDVKYSDLGEKFFSLLYYVTIRESDETKNGRDELKLILKLPQKITNEYFDFLIKFFWSEIFVYNKILPELKSLDQCLEGEGYFQFATSYAGTPKCQEELLLVMDNLIEMNYKVCNRYKSLDYEHTILTIKSLAHFHALTYALKIQNPELMNLTRESYASKKDSIKEFFLFLENCKNQALDVLYEEVHRKRLELYCQDMVEKYIDLLSWGDVDKDAEYNTLCHGDLWVTNILFKYQDEKPSDIIMIDWQIIKYASPLTDLYYLLFTSTDEEFRRKHMDQTLEVYYQTLCDMLKKIGCIPETCYPEDVFRRHVKEKLPFGLFTALTLVPIVLKEKNNSIEEQKVGVTHYSEATIVRLNGVVNDMIRLNVL